MTTAIDAALYLSGLGHAVFPCAPGQKRPATQNGLLDASADPEIVERMFRAAPTGCNLALRTDGLLVVDVDGPDNAWLRDDPDKLLELARAPLSRTPRGGRHYLFRAGDGMRFRNTASKLAPMVDTRADGGYILVAPSIVDGKPYEWLNPLDCEPEKLPEPPAWLIELLTPRGNLESVARIEPSNANAIPDGQRNGTLTRLAGSMRRVGMSADAILAALRKENAERCKPPLPDSEVSVISWSVSRYEPDQIATAIVEDHAGQDAASGEPLERGPADPGPMADSLLHIPGFIDAVTQWNLAEAFKPQAAMALAGGLCLLSTLTGRKIRDAVNTRTNLYCICVGESGCGKERAREVNKQILQAAGLGAMLGPETIASGPGLISAIELQPAILFQLDEIGRLMKTLGNPNQNPYLYNIATALIKLFTSSGTIYKSEAYADAKKNRTINQPHAVVFGTTVQESLYESITDSSLTDGFWNRMFIFEERPTDRQTFIAGEVPKPIIDVARYWGELRVGGNLSSENPQPIVVPTDTEAAKILSAVGELAEFERKRLGPVLGAIWQRAEEKARKVALLFAASANHRSPRIDVAAAEYGRDLIDYSTRRMIHVASRWVAASPYDSKRKSVLRVVESCGPAGATRTLLNNRIPMPARERNEIISDLLDCRLIVAKAEPTATKTATRYVSAKFVDPAIAV